MRHGSKAESVALFILGIAAEESSHPHVFYLKKINASAACHTLIFTIRKQYECTYFQKSRRLDMSISELVIRIVIAFLTLLILTKNNGKKRIITNYLF